MSTPQRNERDELAALQTRISQIPEEAVKVAAAALKRRLGNVLTGDDTEWEMDAYTVLTAAAPFIEKGAYDRGWGAGFRHHSGVTAQAKAEAWDEAVASLEYPDGSKVEVAANHNPYRSER